MKPCRRSYRFFLIGLPWVFIASTYLWENTPLGVWLLSIVAMSWVLARVTVSLDEWWARKFAKEPK